MVSSAPQTEQALGSPQFGPASHLLKHVSPFKADLPSFFLQLDPYRWRVRFDGVQVGRDETAYAFFKGWLGEQSQHIRRDLRRVRRLEGADIHRFLSEWAEKFIEAAAVYVGRPVGEPAAVKFALAGATGVLNEGLELGDDALPHWNIPAKANRKVRLHFQDAIDLGGVYDLDETAMRLERGMGEPKTPPVKGIYNPLPNILNRKGLVREDNYVTFLAEYIVALEGRKALRVQPPGKSASGLQYRFLPLRGLMQWRASVDWISTATDAPEVSQNEELVYPIRACIETFYSSWLIDTFVYGLLNVLFTSETQPQADKDFRAPFALLWWAHDIVFLKDGVCQHVLTRDGAGSLRTLASGAPNDFVAAALECDPDTEGEFCVVKRLDALGAAGHVEPPCHSIRLRLLKSGDNGESLLAFAQSCGFDEVVYRVFLLSHDTEHRREMFRQFVAILCDRIYDAAKEFRRVLAHLTTLRKLEREETSTAAAYELGHTLSHWTAGTQLRLQEVYDFVEGEEGRHLLRVVSRGLTRINTLGNVLDINTRAIRRNVTAEAFFGKKEWYSYSEYNVWQSLVAVAAEVCEGQSDEGEPKRPVPVSLSPLIERARVGRWIHDRHLGRPVRPSNIFYDHVLFELLSNVAGHGELEPESSVVKVEVSVEEHRGETLLVFRNAAPHDKINTLASGIRDFRYGEWFSWGESCKVSVGGLSYVEGVMCRTAAGRIFVRVDPGHVWFGLEISGLKFATEVRS